MIIKNGRVFTDAGKFYLGNVDVKEDKIANVLIEECAGLSLKKAVMMETQEIAPSEDIVIDAAGLYVIPGFVDIHFHGCMGYDFCDGTKEAFDAITEYQVKNGVTSISPATMTLSREELGCIFKAAGEYCKVQEKNCFNRNTTDESSKQEKPHIGSSIRGITMEGPFVSLKKKGAQNGAYIHKPDMDFYREMQNLCGNLIKQVAVAPEEDADFAFIKAVSGETAISVAHTMADYETADKAFKLGASHVTHLFNAMSPFAHRDPAVVGAAFDNKGVFVELICDGVHIHPSVVRTVFALFGAQRVCMISDSMMAAGMADGHYSLGGQAVTVTGKVATLEDGTIAGSASNLYDCFKAAVQQMDIPLEEAVMASTLTPAKSLGIDRECGSITVGKNADFVLLDKDLNIVKVIKDGRIVEI